jgi:hypothetical protein
VDDVDHARRSAKDLVARMLTCRGLIMQLLPKCHVRQHVLVLGEGIVEGHDDFATNDFALNLQVVIRARGVRARGGGRTAKLLEFVTILAVIASDPDVVEKIIEETEMTVESVAEVYRDTKFGRKLRAEGREEERESLPAAVLLERFGEHPELTAIAQRLAAWPDGATAVHAITTAVGVEELRHADPAR